MNLKALLNKKNIILNINVDSKKRLVEFLSNRLSVLNNNVNEDDVIKKIYDREQLGNTYIGKKIYMPHCRVEGLQSTKIMICTLKNEYYDYRANENVNLVVGIFFPEKIVEIHYELLKEIASFFKKPDIQQRLENIKTVDDFYNLIIKQA